MRYNILYSMAFSALLAGCAGSPVRAPVAVQPQPLQRPESQVRAPQAEALLQTLLALGVDYRNGGRSPNQGFDCSGLVAHVFLEAYGMRLPHNTRAQSALGLEVGPSELQPGDLVFYNTLDRPFSHVGIYLGDSRFVHAPKAGSSVRVENIQSAYWRSRFNGARRIYPPI